MDTKLQQEVNEVLKNFPEYWKKDILLKNKVIEDIRAYNEKIIEALLSNNLVKETYALQLPSGSVFKTEDFISMLRFKNYWDNSYTKYTNEIGLTSEGKYLKYNTDIVLDFPHKDSVLEGGMTKDDIGKKEIYYHNVLAKEEIDTLLSPKVLTNAKKYNKRDSTEVYDFNDTDNLILKGNNLLVLSTLKKRYQNSVKGIFIDPPYYFNKIKSNDSFKYNSNFKLSTWLTFMKNRLSISRELLSDKGIIAVVIGVDAYAHLKILMDDVFEVNKDPKRYIGTITWRKTDNQSNIGDFANVIDYILLYRKESKTKLNYLPLTEKAQKEYSYTDTNGEKYRRANILDLTRGRYKYEVITPDGDKLYGPWMIDEKEYKEMYDNDDIHWPSKGKQIPYGKIYLKNTIEKGQISSDFWDSSYGTNQRSADEIKTLFGSRVFDYAKPEKLVQNIISLISNENDIVLDYFMGTATTPAVAMKMNRRFIGIEQMDYIETISLPRLQQVINGEQGGISEELGWSGGGSFVYAELYNLNEKYLYDIQSCKDSNELKLVIKKIKNLAYLNFKVDLEKVTTEHEDFKSLSLEEQKDVLIQVLDMNQLYLNYSEIEDSQYDISDSVKTFNHSFYQKEGD
ncbi:DNA methyltransferase [Mammaliicoccus lentus]|uniref:DNA methyltransferase n=1 Tax=Mammaliicoccus lentus TaxID=42858 RepID=UPI003A599824